MDPMQLLAIAAVVLAIVLVGLTLVVVSMVRNQQQAQKQALDPAACSTPTKELAAAPAGGTTEGGPS